MARLQLHTSVPTALKFFFVALFIYLMTLIAMYYLNDRFALSHICSNGTLASATQINDNIRKTLTQPYTYLSQGSQMFVFESEDHEYVLKFFKHQRYRLPNFLRPAALPSFQKKITQEKLLEKEQKLCKLYQSCQIAEGDLFDSCALIYTHLQQTHDLNIKILLTDKLKRSYQINLDDFEFVLQRKGVLLLPLLTSIIENGQIEEGKRRIDQLISLLETRVQKGILDSDCVITKNIAFLPEKAIFIDIGQFSKTKEIRPFNAVEDSKIFLQLQQWLESKSPILSDYLSQTIKHRLHFF